MCAMLKVSLLFQIGVITNTEYSFFIRLSYESKNISFSAQSLITFVRIHSHATPDLFCATAVSAITHISATTGC
jgi:hypothetical protein